MLTIVRLLRVEQWYKNLVIFLGLFFSKNFLNPELFLKTVVAFVSLCFVSSSYYIINDIIDSRRDKIHSEKSRRPIASGAVDVNTAVLISVVLAVASFAIGYVLSVEFMLFPIALFVSSMVYNLWLRNVAIVDIHVIAFNFLLRAVSGTVLLGVYTSPWLVAAIFFMALFLAIGKRKADLATLGGEAVNYRKVYRIYNEKLLNLMLIVITSLFLFTYILYTFLVHEEPYPYMMLTIPFVSFLTFRYLYFISIDHEVARKTHKLFLDKQMAAGLLMWIVTSIVVIYFLIPDFA